MFDNVQERREAYAKALDKSLEICVSFSEKAVAEVLSNGLRPVADAAGLDRIIIFRVYGLETNTAGEIFRWDRIEGGAAPVDSALRILPVTNALKRWVSVVSEDKCISLRRSQFAEDEAAFLNPRGVQSILIMPVFIEGEFWGVVTFHDNTTERDFDEDCVSLLRSTARLSAVTLLREEKTVKVEQVIEAFKRREIITETLNKTAVFLLSLGGETFKNTVAAGVRFIADMADFDRLFFFQNHIKTGGLHMSQIYRWDRTSGGSSEVIDSYLDIPYIRILLNWEEYLADGNFINSPAKLLPEVQAAALQTYGIVSVAVIPVFIKGFFWGFALFGDSHNERYFEDDIIEMLRSAVFLIANAFIRQQMERDITEETELNQAMIDGMPVGLTTFSEDLKPFDCNKIILNMFGVNKKKEYLDNFFDFSPEYQPDGRKSLDKAIEIMRRAMNGEKQILEWTHRSAQGEFIPCELALMRVRHKGKYIGMGYLYDLRNIRKMQQDVAEAEERASAITEASPIAYVLFNENLSPIDCNSEAIWLFGCADKQHFLENYWVRFMPELQPDGQKSLKKAKALSEHVVTGERNVFEWTYLAYNKESFPAEISLTQIVYKNKNYLIAYIYDLRNIREMEKNIEWLKNKADKIYYDSLTGIYNRRYFDENLKRIMKSLARSESTLGIMMIDIDFFKNYNDTYGHAEGDKCLKTIAKVISQCITRADDFVARYGGEEFVIVLPHTSTNGLRLIAARLLEKVRKRGIPHKSSAVADYVTISIGVTAGKVHHTHNGINYMQRADEALYKSKQTGRNKFTFEIGPYDKPEN
ncbi:MAG: diguanylate cyclase [Treponema sp.]|nr:diguanylate cyclase [Treponema sp.]